MSGSPTTRSLAECRARGYIVQVVERWNPHARRRIDLFGIIDIVAIIPTIGGVRGALIGIQACAASSHAARRDKILAEPRAQQWIEAGGQLELWSWAKRGPRGARKVWTLRAETYHEMRSAT